ncbi:MAG: hypothetical protein HZB31_14195 [Nitrospirae bacterium]|nr:hypothetical protein [Nitrospirota bacterium]
MNKLLPIPILLFVFVSTGAYAYDDPPKHFATKRAAVKNGCQMQPLKDKKKENCIISAFDDHDLKITVYDGNTNGEFEQRNQLTITSWYQMAKISYEDLLGNGIKFIRIESEGNTGTGTLQKILSYWGWHADKFVPVFFETTSYHISSAGGYLEDFKMNYEFNNKGSQQISAALKYHYSDTNPKHRASYTWQEKLSWDGGSFSFYNLELEKGKILKAENPIYKKIINARINQIRRKRSMSIVDTDLLNEIEMMQILYDGAY